MNGDDEKPGNDTQELDEAKRRERDEKIERLARYRPGLLAYMQRCGFLQEEAQDLTQQVFLRVCQNVDAYRGDAAWGYLERVAKHLVLNTIRDRHALKRAAIEESDDKAAGVADKHTVPVDEQLERKERSALLRRAIEQLERPLRACVLLYLEDKSYEEIAKELNLRVSSVKSQLNAARHRLRELMGVDFPGMGGE